MRDIPGWTPSGHCALLTIDIASFCHESRSDFVRQHLRDALYDLLSKSLDGCRISTDDFYCEDRGDGVVVAVAPRVRTAVLVSSFVDWMHSGLRRHNKVSSEVAQLQLRVGVHTGEVDTDEHGLVGTAVNHVFRLTEAPVLKQLLADSSAVIALITSDRVHEDVIRHAPDLVEPDEYRPVEVRTKETVAPAWVRLLGRPTRAPRPIGRSVTSFVGRDRELAELRTLVTRCRLVTLIGAGGAGKTRLAEEVLHGLTDEASPICSDGAYFVDLAAYRPGEDLCLALLTTLRLATLSHYGPPGRGPTDDALVAALAQRRVLLVLDNCEHLLDDVAMLAEALLTRTEETTLLATSREALRARGETTFAVDSLALPKDEDTRTYERWEVIRYPAVRLFVDRARMADPDFQFTDQNHADVTRICRRLDGLPLAIELAAARVRALTPAQIAEVLADRFSVLSRGSRTVPRHRTLQAAMDWSHDLLDEPTKEVFAYLSTFRGPFSLPVLRNLAVRLGLSPDTTIDLVLRLVDKSLLRATPATDGAMRYRMLETVREYAADRLAGQGRAQAAARHHAELYVELAEENSAVLRSADQAVAVRMLEQEDGNLRAAFEFCCQHGNHALALRMVAALGWYLWMRGDRAFGWPGVARALSTRPDEQDPLLRARALTWSCHLGSVGHRAVEPQARVHGRQAQEILERLELTGTTDYGYCMFVLAFSSYRQDHHVEGDAMTARALRLGAELDDPWLTACATCVAGIGHALRGEFTESAHWLDVSARHYRTTGDAWGEHRALVWLSRTHESTGDLRRAEETAEACVALVRGLELGDAVVPLLGWLARLRILRGDETGAASALAAVERNRWWRSTSEGIGWITDCQALLTEARAGDQPEQLREAAALYGQAADELAAAGLPIHALHSRCRQVVVLARAGDSPTEALDLALRLADTQSDRRAQAIILDARCLVTRDRDEAVHLLAEAEKWWTLTGVSRSPRFAGDVRSLRAAAG